MRRKTVRAVYASDTHCPDHRTKAVSWAAGKIAEFKPDYLVFGGDLFEADAASRFYNEQKYDILAEYEAGARVMNLLSGAAPESRLIWTLGNHDFNITAKGRIDKRVRDAVHWNRSEWGESFRRWTQIPYDFSARGVFQLGQAMFWHGHDGAEDLNAIRVNNACGGYAHRLLVGGHVHVPRLPTAVERTRRIPLPLWIANAGTLGPLRPEWTTRQDTSRWGAGIVKVELTMGRACQPAKNWACDVEVMS